MRKSASVGALQNAEVSTLVREVAALVRGIVRGVTAEQAAAFGSEQARVYRECCRVCIGDDDDKYVRITEIWFGTVAGINAQIRRVIEHHVHVLAHVRGLRDADRREAGKRMGLSAAGRATEEAAPAAAAAEHHGVAVCSSDDDPERPERPEREAVSAGSHASAHLHCG